MIYLLLSFFYMSASMMSPILHAEILHVGSWQFFAWTPITALMTAVISVINQNFGKEKARQVVASNLIIRALFYLGLFPLIFLFPSARDLGVTALLTQTFRNFMVSESTTFILRYWLVIPVFTKMKGKFSWKYAITSTLMDVSKATVQTFLMYVGVAGVSVWQLISTDLPTKMGFMLLSIPIASGINYLVNRYNK